jgi:hypothetical protein
MAEVMIVDKIVVGALAFSEKGDELGCAQILAVATMVLVTGQQPLTRSYPPFLEFGHGQGVLEHDEGGIEQFVMIKLMC